MEENKFSNINNNNKNYNLNLKTIKNNNSKIIDINDNIFSILEYLQQESNKNNYLKCTRKIDDFINNYISKEDILKKINECYDDFTNDLRSFLRENINFDYMFLGERVIEKESSSKNDESNHINYNSNTKNKIVGFSLLNDIKTENTENIKNKNKCIQKIFIRLNNIDDSLEVLFQNIDIMKRDENEDEVDKNDNKNKNLFHKTLPEILIKICYKIKNSILNIIESTKEIKQKHYYEDKNNRINIKKRDFYIKNIKYLAKSINFVISDLELLGDVVSSYDNPNELINRIKYKIINREGIYNLEDEIEKIKKIFQNKINSSKKEIQIISSFKNIPKKIKLEVSLLQSCIFNILSNSVKFTTKGIINIKMNFNFTKKKLCIEISDQGIGIKKEKLKRLGNLVYNTDKNDNDFTLGVGLFTVKMITKAFNGTLKIISEYGQGTYISIQLPLAEEIINLTNGNKEKIYRLSSNTFVIENNEKEKNYYKNLLNKNNKFNFTENRSSYNIYPYKNYFSSGDLLPINIEKNQDRLINSQNFKRKSFSTIKHNFKKPIKNLTVNKTQLSNFIKSNTKSNKELIFEEIDKNNLSSIIKIESNYDETNLDNKINNIFFENSSNQNSNYFSSVENKSTIRNSNFPNMSLINQSNNSSFKDTAIIIDKSNKNKTESLNNSTCKNFINNITLI